MKHPAKTLSGINFNLIAYLFDMMIYQPGQFPSLLSKYSPSYNLISSGTPMHWRLGGEKPK